MKMEEKRKIIIVSFVIVLIIGGIAASFFFSPKPITDYQEELYSRPEEEEEIFRLAGWVLEVNPDNDFLTIESDKDGKIFKVFVDEGVNMLKIELPDNYSDKKYVITTKTKIKLADFVKGDYISLRTRENIAGKTEFAEVIHIYLYPFVAGQDED